MKSEYSLGSFFQVIVKNLIIIVVCMFLGSGFAGLYAKHKQSTTYSAQTNIVVGHNLDKVHYRNSTVMSDINMMDTYEGQIKDPQVMNRAHSLLSKQLRKEYSPKEIESNVHVSSEDHSLVMEIKATTSSKKDSPKIANAVAEAFKDEFKQMNPSSAEVKLLAPAKEKDVTSKTSPSVKKYAVLGAALGVLIGMLIAFGWTSYRKIH